MRLIPLLQVPQRNVNVLMEDVGACADVGAGVDVQGAGPQDLCEALPLPMESSVFVGEIDTVC